jgi:hypothetical protein
LERGRYELPLATAQPMTPRTIFMAVTAFIAIAVA